MNENRLILRTAPTTPSDDRASRLTEIAREARAAFVSDEVRHLRALYAVLNADRHGCMIAGLTVCEPALIERLLIAGVCDSAALALLGSGCGYMISRGAAGEHIATVLLSGQAEEQTGSGDSLALALVAAIATALAASADGSAVLGQTGRQTSLRLN